MIFDISGNTCTPGIHQLGADCDRKHHADKAGEDGEPEIERPDVLMVGGK